MPSAVLSLACLALVCAATALADDRLPPPNPLEVYRNLHRLGISARPGDHAYRVPSSSMEPTLHCAKPAPSCEAGTADRVLVRPYARGQRPRRGDLVAFAAPPSAAASCGAGGTFLKRVLGLPGDHLQEDGRGFIVVNGKRLDEPYVQPVRRERDVENRNRTWVVPHASYFLLGDNRWQSCDSRRWGAVRPAAIVGKVLAIYWPTARARRE